MAFILVGKLLDVGDIIQRTEKFRTRDVILLIEKFYKKEDKSYPVKFQCSNNKCEELDGQNIKDALRLGLVCTIEFEINGYAGKDGNVWNNLSINSVTPRINQKAPMKQTSMFVPESRAYAYEPPTGGPSYDLNSPFIPVGSSEDDDLPF